MSIKEYNEILAFHPGYYIGEIIDEMEITQEEFAKRLEITPKALGELINGKTNLSKEIAKKLSTVLGMSIEVWLNLQTEFECKCRIIMKEKVYKVVKAL